MKKCEDCEHSIKQKDTAYKIHVRVCLRFAEGIITKTGRNSYYSCIEQRSGKCWPDARYFEQKKTLLYRIVKKIGVTL